MRNPEDIQKAREKAVEILQDADFDKNNLSEFPDIMRLDGIELEGERIIFQLGIEGRKSLQRAALAPVTKNLAGQYVRANTSFKKRVLYYATSNLRDLICKNSITAALMDLEPMQKTYSVAIADENGKRFTSGNVKYLSCDRRDIVFQVKAFSR